MVHDLIVVGGGIAGSSVALAARRAGLRVLVLEAETAFRDRIRGEGLHPWGVREARRLELTDLLYERCARALPLWDTYVGGQLMGRRDLRTDSAAACESMAFFHPDMQKALLTAAERCGAEVRRGARASGIEPGPTPSVTFEVDGENVVAAARLVVVATGRGSAMRTALGLATVRGEPGLKTTGVLLDHIEPGDAVAMFFAPTFGRATPVFPLPRSRARLYFAAHPRGNEKGFSGPTASADLLACFAEMGVPAAWLEHAEVAGPIATFDGTPTWASGAWPQGVALVGDVAGSLDPAFGAGLSLALLDARTLAERVISSAQFEEGRRDYEAERARYYAKLVRLESWVGRILYGNGPRANGVPNPSLLPRLGQLGVDLIGAGPLCRIDDDVERALFGDIGG